MAQNFLACDRDQSLLLPPNLREWLAEDHLAWFVLDAVEDLDLGGVLRRLSRSTGSENTRSSPSSASCSPPPTTSSSSGKPPAARNRLNARAVDRRRPRPGPRTEPSAAAEPPPRRTPDDLYATASRKPKSELSGDGGNRTHVRNRVRMASTSVAGALVSPLASLAGRVARGQPHVMFPDRLRRTSPGEPAF